MNWQQQVQSAFHSVAELLNYLEIPEADRSLILESSKFPLKVPLAYAQRMIKGRIDCPLLKQVLPLAAEEELSLQSNMIDDPLMEKDFVRSSGVLQKFQGRCLVITTPHCPVHCRYCFRREFDYQENALSLKDWSLKLQEFKEQIDLQEIIFSGGDPLSLSDRRLALMINDLKTLDHIKTIRIHTRFPVMIPDRLTDELLETVRWKEQDSKRIVIVLHINHPRELDEILSKKLKAWSLSGVTFLNQSVLLKDINDSVTILKELSYRCFESGVLPYYLHQVDSVTGAAHFEVPLSEGIKLSQALRDELPGYLVPLFVKEVPHQGSKVPLVPRLD